MSRDLEAARRAYMAGNIEMSRKAHDTVAVVEIDKQSDPLKT